MVFWHLYKIAHRIWPRILCIALEKELKVPGSGGDLVTKSCSTLATPWTVACQAPLSMGFSRQEYCPSPGVFPTQESNLGLLHCRQILYQLSYREALSMFEFHLVYVFVCVLLAQSCLTLCNPTDCSHPWLCLMTTLLSFSLLWLFSFVSAFLTSLIKLILSQKAGRRHAWVARTIQSCSLSILSDLQENTLELEPIGFPKRLDVEREGTRSKG